MYRSKQYKNMIKRWKIHKNINSREMRAIIRKRREREAANPPKKSEFRVRGRNVPIRKIERFLKDKNTTRDSTLSDAGMSQALVFGDAIPLISPRNTFRYQLLHTKKRKSFQR